VALLSSLLVVSSIHCAFLPLCSVGNEYRSIYGDTDTPKNSNGTELKDSVPKTNTTDKYSVNQKSRTNLAGE
jgi:hypothetical protein